MKDDNINTLEIEIASLKHDQDRLERNTRRNYLRITRREQRKCVREGPDLCNKKLHIPVEPKEIERVHRFGRPGVSPRQILVKFATNGVKVSVFKAKAVLRQGDGISMHRGRRVMQLAWHKGLTTLKRHLPHKRPTILRPMTTMPTTILTPTLIIPRFLFRRTWCETDNSWFRGPDWRRKARKYVIVGQLLVRQ